MPDNDPVMQLLGRMEGKLDAALAQVAGHDGDIQHNEARIDEHGNRLTKLETKLNLAWGAVGFLFVMLATAAGLIQAFH